MMAEVVLRRAVVADAALLRRWDRDPGVIAATTDDPGAEVAFENTDWAQEIAGDCDANYHVIAEVDGRPIGAVRICDPHREHTHFWGDIGPGLRALDIWIGDAADRGCGFGTEMMYLAHDLCFADDAVTAIVLDPLESNAEARRFYRRLGYVDAGMHVFGDGNTEQIMRRDRRPIDGRAAIRSRPALSDDTAPVPADMVAAWRDRGAVVVSQLLPEDRLRELRAASVADLGPIDPDAPGDFGSGGRFVFPSECEAFNHITLHPRLLAAVAQLLGTEVRDLRLTQSDLWVKHGRTRSTDDPFDNDDQRMHVDYPNHSLVHPPAWQSPEAVEVIVYLDRALDCDGSTCIVLRDAPDDPAYRRPIVDTPGVGVHEWINARASAEAHFERVDPDVAAFRAALYQRERPIDYVFGDVLLYRHDTWHRGTPVRPGTSRVAHNLAFRRADADWISTVHEGWAWSMYRRSRVMETLIATLSVDQRCVLGFPAPGHRYWTPDTLAAVAARYGPLGFDPSEYHNS
jgi:aminoglycoside 6'-N-acetyltransferase